MSAVISNIIEGSIADDLKLNIGDEILTINGNHINDIVDYRYNINDEYIEITVRSDNETLIFEIEKDYDDDLGIEFEDIIFDKLKTCGANCIFCFEKQLPKTMRKTLFLRDDDYRLSFLNGNYITMANLTQEDIKRIITQRLSPLYVSIHTVDDNLREKIIGRKFKPVLETINKLTSHGIQLHTQVVACPGINDSEELINTIDTLSKYYPNILSLAVVPVGLTRYRENLPKITPYTKKTAQKVLDIITEKQKNLKKKLGTNFVWASDEFYIKAKRELPANHHYEDYSQIENGIGLVRDFLTDAKKIIKRINNRYIKTKKSFTLITGVSFYPYLKEIISGITNDQITFNLIPIKNDFFGHTVTVTGLICGQDIINQLKDKEIGDYLVIPEVCLLEDELFLDDLTVSDIEYALNTKVIIGKPYLSDTFKILTNIK